MASIFERDLPRTRANYTVISPLSFIERAAAVYPNEPAVIHGFGEHVIQYDWATLYRRCRQLASSLHQRGIKKGDTVAVMLPNIPAMVEAHFGIPMLGAVLNTLNTRLDAKAIAYMLDHGEASAVIVDTEFAAVMQEALALRRDPKEIFIIDVADPLYDGAHNPIGTQEYEAFIADGDPNYAWQLPEDEWEAICLNYTSGTTGDPKGVVYHHRGAALGAISSILDWDMPTHARYLWTLPMFHCNGWCFPWAIAARAGVNVCLRRVDPVLIFEAIRQHGVDHYCGAPVVHSLLIDAPDELKTGVPAGVKAMVAGAAPPASMLEGMEALGFNLLHVYGLTETYGPATVCAKHGHWAQLDIADRAQLNARQGVGYQLLSEVAVLDENMNPVPADGETIGEIMFRGNIVMKGYLKNPEETQEAFKDGWFHSGDLAVVDPDGYLKIMDRSKDIIISGGENISSIEIEDVLYRHPAVVSVAVVAQPHEKWGETPCAFIELKANAQVTEKDIQAHCKNHLARFKIPRSIVFCEVPKTATGKIQKFELREKAAALVGERAVAGPSS